MGQRGVSIAVVVLVAVVVNFPVAHATHLRWQLDRSGEDLIATVEEGGAYEVGDDFVLVVTIPESERRAEFVGGIVRVDEATFKQARDTGTIAARALPEREGVFEVRGQQRSRAGLVATIVADLFLVLIVALRWRLGARPFDDEE